MKNLWATYDIFDVHNLCYSRALLRDLKTANLSIGDYKRPAPHIRQLSACQINLISKRPHDVHRNATIIYAVRTNIYHYPIFNIIHSI